MNAKIIYGTAWKKETTTSLVVAAVLNGFRAIDTAAQPKHYREELVGNALKILYDEYDYKREDFMIQTKFTSFEGQDPAKPLPYDPNVPLPTQILNSFQSSLTNLHTLYLDSYVLHSPMPTLQATLEAWRILIRLQDSGKVRAIGISNCYEVEILEALWKERRVQVVQNRWWEGNGWDREVVRWCRERGVQYQSFWTLTGSPTLLHSPALSTLSTALNCTPAQALYRFAQAEGVIPLSGTTNEKHMKQDTEVERIELDAQGVDEKVKAVRKVIWGEE